MSTISSLQTALAAEHAAIFLYGDAGAHTSQSAEPDLFGLVSMLYRTHRSRRDQLRLLITDLGATPVAAASSYEVPARLASPAAVRRLAVGVEERSAEVYAALVANTVGTDRGWAISALAGAAQARVLLGAEPQTFPGAPDLG